MKKIAFSELTCITRNYKLNHLEFDEKFEYLILNSGEAKGYYSRGNFLHEQKKSEDFHLFLVVKKAPSCFQDIVIRESIKLSKGLKYDLHLNPGQISFENKPAQIIRFRAIELEYLHTIVENLNKQGIEFIKDKKVETFDTVAFYKKYIEFKEISEGVYQDSEVDARFFLKVPGLLSFGEFEQIILKIKNKFKYHLFESFLAQLYFKNSMKDFIGIYSKNCDINNFGELKKEIETYYMET